MRSVLVTGSRQFNDGQAINTVLNLLGPGMIIEGGARGADSLAASWAIENEVHHACFPADWDSQGQAAGRIRNRNMLAYLLTQPDPLVVAFKENFRHDMKKGGTEHMVKCALIEKVETWVNPHHSSFSGAHQLDLWS